MVVETEPHIDNRGGFFRTFCKKEFANIGLTKEFVQINQSINKLKGTFRGFHYQKPPFTDEKLVRCISGSVLDIVIDIRKNSNSFLNYFSIELSAKNKKMLYVPYGFAHGFVTLENDTELIYHHTAYYEPDAESGINYKDELLHIELPMKINMLSEKDKNYPYLNSNFKGI